MIVNVGLLTGAILDNTPTNGEIQDAAANLTNGHSAGASRMRARHLKEWLQGAKLEENPDCQETSRRDTANKCSLELCSSIVLIF